MGRKINFDVSGVNIRVHTVHEPLEYVALWEAMNKTRSYIVHANNALMIGDLRYADKDDPHGLILGNFYRFLEVDLENPWFDIDKHKKAAEEDVDKVKIPVALKPNLTEIPYVFNPKTHQLYFVSKSSLASASPHLVHKLLSAICQKREISDKFNKVDLTILTDKGKVEEMLNWPEIRNLSIKIERPNPVDQDDERAVYDRLRARRLESETTIYKKASGESSIIPDEEMKARARIAANNGLVEVSGKNLQRVSDKASSSDFPLKLKGIYDSKLQPLLDALKAVILNI